MTIDHHKINIADEKNEDVGINDLEKIAANAKKQYAELKKNLTFDFKMLKTFGANFQGFLQKTMKFLQENLILRAIWGTYAWSLSASQDDFANNLAIFASLISKKILKNKYGELLRENMITSEIYFFLQGMNCNLVGSSVSLFFCFFYKKQFLKDALKRAVSRFEDIFAIKLDIFGSAKDLTQMQIMQREQISESAYLAEKMSQTQTYTRLFYLNIC
jgi:hypothetical protein